ncbi:MAG: F0F1 ATP synthase subunit epsilon, partial [Pirellulaceae bacterium]|nr:F0F1 ATP synthase subunit epsilon [Pirellulaceae bacterium]
VQVADDLVSVLTNRAIPVAELDGPAARDQLAAARELPSNTPELMAIRDRQVAQARAQIRLAS